MVMVAITKAAVSRIYVVVTAFTCSDNALARNDGIIYPTMVVIRAFFTPTAWNSTWDTCTCVPLNLILFVTLLL